MVNIDYAKSCNTALIPRDICVTHNVGPPLLKGSPIMSLGACLFRIRAMIAEAPRMCFDFGA